MSEKRTRLLSANLIVLVYGIVSLGIEMLSLNYFECSHYFKHPGYPFLLWLTILLVLFLLQSKKLKSIYSFLFLILQCLIILASNYLFLSNGTVFERSMLKQRNDAYATIEQFSLSPGLLFLCIFSLAAYLVFLIIYMGWCKRKGSIMFRYDTCYRRIVIAICILLLVLLKLIPVMNTNLKETTNYESILYQSCNSYQDTGITGNFIYEMLRGDTESVDISDLSDIEETIYEKRCDTSIYHGISSGNNLVMILAESFEWYPLTIYSKEQTAQIYPNLSKLMEESVLCDNFYSREKTDTAESLMIVGSNPTGKYTHNDFADNSYPYSLPNLYRQQALSEGDDAVIIKSYHQNKGSFYNRNHAHKSFGFDELVDVDDMKKFGVVNTWDSQKRERTLDSLTMNAMKDDMFPTDQRFFTYWITFSTHGFYHERENLSEYYALFDKLGVFPKGDQYENYLRTYAAAVADLDKAIGIMLDDLDRKQLLDNTTIAIIADHNTYYNSLSNYAKNIDTQYNPELYRVPVIIYDQKLNEAMDIVGDSRILSKFTTTSDIVPTLLDLLGISAWDNLYLGSTMFNKERESIIYSRAYNLFINDQYIGYSLNDLKYEAPSSTLAMKSEFEAKALAHLNKLEIIDKIFYSDYFSKYRYRP
ncbi:MAG TPA: LTA synthase family protein [Lachnospiraceae bacterium]|nr:LTA synthase family protein [Lachnospiraceae bacterium]